MNSVGLLVLTFRNAVVNEDQMISNLTNRDGMGNEI